MQPDDVITRAGRSTYRQAHDMRLAVLLANNGQVGNTWYGDGCYAWEARKAGLRAVEIAGLYRRPYCWERWWRRLFSTSAGPSGR